MKLEDTINRVMPYLIIPFSLLIIADMIFDLTKYILMIIIFDSVIIIILATDLHFKYKTYKVKKEFFKEYWIDFFALIPYYFYLRLIKLIRLVKATRILSRIKLHFIPKLKAAHHLRKKKK